MSDSQEKRYVDCVWCGETIHSYTGPKLDHPVEEIVEVCRKHDLRCAKNPLVAELAKERKRSHWLLHNSGLIHEWATGPCPGNMTLIGYLESRVDQAMRGVL